jgi:hypothetical protein
MRKSYALSIKQPWAALVVAGLKTIEVRSWLTKIRGRILIHAARIPDSRPQAWQWVTDEVRPLADLTGGVIGQVNLLDCIAYPDPSRFAVDTARHLNDPSWFQARGLYGFVFEKAEIVPFRRLPGNVRFFTVEKPR